MHLPACFVIGSLGVVFFYSPQVAYADGKATLKAEIEAASINENDEEKHRVEVNECGMTTYRWKLHEGEWVLWSSFKFSMTDVELYKDKSDENKRFIAVPHTPGLGKNDVAIISFTMKNGLLASFERSNHRKVPADKPSRPSPRNEGETHHIVESDDFFILQTGPNVIEKARRFTNAFAQYVKDYCTFLG